MQKRIPSLFYVFLFNVSGLNHTIGGIDQNLCFVAFVVLNGTVSDTGSIHEGKCKAIFAIINYIKAALTPTEIKTK